MDSSAITQFLDSIMESPAVTGVILCDIKSGLCLGAAGKAKEDDAPQLTVASRQACDNEGVGVVSLRGSRVVLRRGETALVGVFKDV
ncbi:hypothetical protein BZA05DRAFT_444140 [Tricharina praecox]|uniref:uncharacterized protein n=1 Tax=Tricharina praecox TaxID=43433 RepID=UPI00222127DD|nr:uncharacterized protein BZA05DRAFT_444140 [Tricharina praecox]KAI5853866.1 hypothetical protein BZA05DRAFT_444140 [Tricharina praecox]